MLVSRGRSINLGRLIANHSTKGHAGAELFRISRARSSSHFGALCGAMLLAMLIGLALDASSPW